MYREIGEKKIYIHISIVLTNKENKEHNGKKALVLCESIFFFLLVWLAGAVGMIYSDEDASFTKTEYL